MAEARCAVAGTAPPAVVPEPGGGVTSAATPPPNVVVEPSGVVASPIVPAVPGTGNPVTDEQLRQEEFLRQQAANKAFRQRGNLDPEASDGARACAAEVSQGLNLLPVGGQDEPEQEVVERALAVTGLVDVVVRPPGRLDLGPGNGLLFAGWTGRACVFGSVRRDDIQVEVGTRIADGGCLPAPD
ncbi:hypothetical protein Vqi01_39760 [Micromonospora qiuiae]|uniref:Uncharacterized protein n=1 Tax=Micromonospora qiuiae TaxID=502268 RepID=A0ABQ4JH68_9ACTN|nr:hypothetical protein [Micromonospora qiuiae]GIJ28814.1 hypothetical protein Vqi01_39760 [Micromonospora qiuiae]